MKQNPASKSGTDNAISYNRITLVEGTAESIQQTNGIFSTQSGVLGGLCKKGSAVVQINNTLVTIKSGELYGVTPGQSFAFEQASKDFEYTAVFVPQFLIAEFKQNINQKFILGALTHRTFPMPQKVYDDLNVLIELMRRHMQEVNGRFQTVDDTEQAIVLSIIDSIILISNTAVPSRLGNKTNMSRQEAITRHFCLNLLKHYKSHHNVEFYADMEGVSAKYLSTVVRMVTDKPVQDWINMIVIYAAKRMLKNSEASIADVAKELNFSSASSFIRYFRNATGDTPRAFRFKE